MPTILAISLLIALFLVLGFAADQVAKNSRILAIKLGLPIFLLGIILGVLTSFPDAAIAINATIDRIPGLSIGNLLGGTIVMFSLILGLSVALNRETKNDGRLGFLALCLAYIFLPLVMGLKGGLNIWDGFILIILYFLLLVRLYQAKHQLFNFQVALVNEKKVLRETGTIIAGLILIILSSHLIMTITTGLLSRYSLSPFLIGLLFFSIGTNLPELTLAIAAWRRHDKELSFSNLLGSGLVNSLLIGILVTIRPFDFALDYSFFVTLITIALLAILILFFYRSGRKMSRYEGLILIAVYIIFIVCQFLSDPLHI